MQRLATRAVLEEEPVVAARVRVVVRARGGHEVDVLLARVRVRDRVRSRGWGTDRGKSWGWGFLGVQSSEFIRARVQGKG